MDQSILADLALNGALSLSFLGLWGAAMALAERARWERAEWAVKVGLLSFGAALTILIAAHFDQGVIFDQRGTMIGLAVLNGGPWAGVLAAVAAAAARWWVGGIGMIAGLEGIVFDLVLAVVVVRLLDRAAITSAWVRLGVTGSAVGAGEAASAWLIPGLPEPLPLAVLLLTAQVTGTLFIGGLLVVLEERRRLRKAVQEQLDRLRAILFQTIDAFTEATVHSDPYTAGHERRVADLCLAIGRQMGLSPDRLDGLRVAAEIHDIGQLNIPSEILLRPSPLSSLEMRFVHQHSDVGAEILSHVDFPWPVADTVRQHHENFDGTGYPAGLAGERILLEARILRVADTMEAMCSHRPFRSALPVADALAVLENGRGTTFDPQVVDRCHHLFTIDGYAFPTQRSRPMTPTAGEAARKKAGHHAAPG